MVETHKITIKTYLKNLYCNCTQIFSYSILKEIIFLLYLHCIFSFMNILNILIFQLSIDEPIITKTIMNKAFEIWFFINDLPFIYLIHMTRKGSVFMIWKHRNIAVVVSEWLKQFKNGKYKTRVGEKTLAGSHQLDGRASEIEKEGRRRWIVIVIYI